MTSMSTLGYYNLLLSSILASVDSDPLQLGKLTSRTASYSWFCDISWCWSVFRKRWDAASHLNIWYAWLLLNSLIEQFLILSEVPTAPSTLLPCAFQPRSKKYQTQWQAGTIYQNMWPLLPFKYMQLVQTDVTVFPTYQWLYINEAKKEEKKAISTFSFIGLHSSNGVCMCCVCVCVCVWAHARRMTVKCALRWHSHISVLHTHTYILSLRTVNQWG